jgi:hypothetical protein
MIWYTTTCCLSTPSLTSISRSHSVLHAIPRAPRYDTTQYINQLIYLNPLHHSTTSTSNQLCDLDNMNHYDPSEDPETNGPFEVQPERDANNFQYPTYPTSFVQDPHYLPSQPGPPYNEFSTVPGYQDGFQYQAETGPSYPVIEVIPVAQALAKPPTPNPPSHLQHLFEAYTASYNDNASPNSTRMEHAKALALALALALLQHYYPESQGYMVRPSSLGQIAKHGMNFLRKGNDGSDPHFNLLPPKKDSKKGKKKKPTKKQEQAESARQFNHWWPLTVAMNWHVIEPKDIAGLEVLKRTTIAGAENEHVPYTYLAIMIDDLETFPSFAATYDVHRGDILTDVLCRTQKIQSGYGILLFGTRLEFYGFSNGAETRIDGSDSDEYVEGMVSIDEPSVALAAFANGTEMAVDLRTMGLQLVDEAFREMGKINVEYLDEGHEVEDG